MINIEKGSLWYRVALYGVFFEECHLSPNLCPFMRRVLLGAFLILGYVMLAALILVCLGTPIVQLLMVILHGGAYWETNTAMVLGSTSWGMIVLVLLCWFFGDTTAGEQVRTTIDDQYDKLNIDNWIVVEYYKALHNKMCPQLSFSGDIVDAHIGDEKHEE